LRGDGGHGDLVPRSCKGRALCGEGWFSRRGNGMLEGGTKWVVRQWDVREDQDWRFSVVSWS
jgi:hypothetical protein